MPTTEPLFATIEPRSTPRSRWLASLLIHGAAVAVIVAIPAAVEEEVQPLRRVEDVRLIAPRPVSPPPVVRPPRLPAIRKRVEAKLAQFVPPPRITAVKKPQLQVPEPAIAKVETPPAPVILPVAPALPAPRPIATPAVKVGGFGDVNGVRPSVDSNGKSLTVAKLGAFDLPSGPGAGGGGGTSRGVSTGGFGDAVAGASGGSLHGGSGHGGAVRSAGFGAYDAPASGPRAVKAASPLETPVEITFKPKPVYTSVARERKVEGEVQLEVLFCGSGRIVVLRVVHGLGFGLDDSAREAAERIRFRPGTKDGSPVDMRGIVHIVFELS